MSTWFGPFEPVNEEDAVTDPLETSRSSLSFLALFTILGRFSSHQAFMISKKGRF